MINYTSKPHKYNIFTVFVFAGYCCIFYANLQTKENNQRGKKTTSIIGVI